MGTGRKSRHVRRRETFDAIAGDAVPLRDLPRTADSAPQMWFRILAHAGSDQASRGGRALKKLDYATVGGFVALAEAVMEDIELDLSRALSPDGEPVALY